MSKYELELNDDQAESLIKVLEYAAAPGDLSGFSSDLALSAAASLRGQIPIPVPVKIGAVVKTDSKLCAPDLSVFLRWASDEQTNHPWILREELDRKPYSTEEIGRITEVLSPGVDL